MKSVIDQLTPTEKKALALFYETPTYKALEKMIKLERLELAKDAIEQREISEVRYLHGGSIKLKGILTTIKEIYKKSEKS